MRILIIYTVIFLGAASLTAQNKDPYEILSEVKKEFETIKDYSVDAVISVDVYFLRVPESHAKIYFKQPDMVKMESEGFALIPKQGLNFFPVKLLDNDFTAIYVKEDKLDNIPVDVVKVIPSGDSLDVILSTIWIDPALRIIRRIETTTRETGTVEISLLYDTPGKLCLPFEVSFSFNVAGLNIPSSFTGEFGQEIENETDRQLSGTVTVVYKNYKINIGLDDKIFTDGE